MRPFILQLADFEERAAESRSMSELDDAFQSFATQTGFENWSAVLVQPPRGSEPIRYIGRPVGAWAERYVEQDYARIDAVIRQLKYSNNAVWWTDFAKNARLDKAERNMFGEAAEFKIAEGLSTAVRLARGHVWMCAATSSEKKLTHGIENAFHFCFELYVRHAYRFQPFSDVGAGMLTPKEREIVVLLAEGKTQKEAAAILGKSERTVYNQIACAKERLGVDTIMVLLAFL